MSDHWISPNYLASEGGPDPRNWSIDFMINVFFDRIDGWHLAIADQCLSNIEHSAWAALQIALSYFEIAGFFTCRCLKGKNWERFREGFFSVFPGWKNKNPDVPEILWDVLRNRLYHTGVRNKNPKVRIIASRRPVFHWDSNAGVLILDPHQLVLLMRTHLREYVEKLRDSTNTQLREDFKEAFSVFYEG